MKVFRKSLLVSALMAVGMTSAHAAAPAATIGNKFVMLNPGGGNVGENDVAFTWDGTYNTNVATSVVNASLVLDPAQVFFGYAWTAHDVKVYSGAPTTYNFFNGHYPSVTVGANQVALTMLFDWNVDVDIEVVEICEPGVFSATGYVDATVWDCHSVDGNGDAIPGFPMVNGPFIGFNANFNLMGLVAPAGVASGAAVVDVVRPTSLTSGPSGGGCAMDPTGRDVSLLLAVLGGLGYTSWRRRRS